MKDRIDLLHEMSDEAKLGQSVAGEWAKEREVVNNTFLNMLKLVTADGSNKRQKGEKPPWWKDDSHEKAIFSHLNKWKHGELRDSHSRAHPLIHLAWRALAIAWQETRGKVDPAKISVAQEEKKQ